jgi:hypothetical protein
MLRRIVFDCNYTKYLGLTNSVHGLQMGQLHSVCLPQLICAVITNTALMCKSKIPFEKGYKILMDSRLQPTWTMKSEQTDTTEHGKSGYSFKGKNTNLYF